MRSFRCIPYCAVRQKLALLLRKPFEPRLNHTYYLSRLIDDSKCYDENRHVTRRVGSDLIDPLLEVIERLSVGDIKNDDCPCAASVISGNKRNNE